MIALPAALAKLAEMKTIAATATTRRLT